jgi:integrase
MTYAFARIGAVVAMRVEDYYPEGKRWWVRLHEKGGKRQEVPTHHKLEVFIDECLAAAGIREDGKGYLFRSAIGKTGTLTDKPMNRVDAYRIVRRRTANAGFKVKLGCHVFRATGRTLRGRPNRAGPNILSVWSAASDSTRNLTPDKNRSVSPLTRFSEHGPHILSRRGALRMAPC